ncbi:FAS1-like dehydratase domain-containing protein [Natronorubrum sulfidifaciens]|uniref:MaoC domain-containing protein dehydratase n=1 Tax=Natronorubrum sulfidifaciens JCM 14089 TaxID=1230460 RepID=L9WFJ6_9EURY|nr:MaoC family dehydratase N-terminal domain-containing protein [Natronorubrum sulfidifaciens]ELY48137.1 MaoC domain-containing protein dehydratase [Natronorubrum sulfidifaciens JCM 14089]
MADLEAMVGDSRVTVEEFRIERGKVEEFARAITDRNPVFRDAVVARERGYDRIPAPLTYARVSTFPRYRADGVEGHGFDLGFEPEYVLHGEQAYEYERPLQVGDVLTGTTTLSDVYQRDGGRAGTMTFAVYETAYRDGDDELVLTERATVIETEGAVQNADAEERRDTAAGSSDATSETAAATVGTEPDAEVRSPVTSIDDIAVGDTGPTIVVDDLSRQQFVKYAGASGDFNPIHYDEPYARAAGNESVFGQGMFTAGVTSRAVTDWVGLEAVSSFRVRFHSQVFPGETIIANGEVVDSQPSDGVVELALEATTHHGEPVLTGTATVALSTDN